MFQSATRVSMLMLIFSLVLINFLALWFYPETAFKETFMLFSNITSGIVGYFTGKSMQDSNKPMQEVKNVEKEEFIGLK